LFGNPRDFEDFLSLPLQSSLTPMCYWWTFSCYNLIYNLDKEGIQKLVDKKRIFLADSNIHGGMYKIDAV